jgi:hypothetical protein
MMVVPMQARTTRGARTAKTAVALALGGAAVVGAGVLPGAAQPAGMQAATGGAQASGMYLRYGIPGFLVVENFLDGGGPVAQSLADTSSGSGSFASLPYPGETAIAGPGTLSGLGAPRLPDWPFYVSASNPTRPAQSLSDPSGSYRLDAAAEDGKAAASARGGEPAQFSRQATSQSEAHTDVLTTAEGVTATATSAVDGFTMGPLSIMSVASKAVTTYHGGDAKPTTTTELRVDGGKVGNLGFHYGPEGLTVNNQAVAVPAAEGLKTLNQALAPAGLTLQVENPAPLEGGARAAALEIVSVAPIPGAGTGTLRIALGGASSYVSVGQGSGLTPELPDVTPSAEGAPAPAPASGGAAAPTTSLSDNGFRAAAPALTVSPLRGAAGSTSGEPYGPTSTPDGPAAVSSPAAAPAPGPSAAPDGEQLAATPTQFLVSPKDFDGPSLLAALAAAGGLAAVGMVVLTRRMRKVTQWGA